MAEKAWFTPPPLSSRRRQIWERDLQETRSFSIDMEGETLRGWETGAGPLVLLVHGWGGRASQMAQLGQVVAAAGFNVVALDSPGHGLARFDRSNVFEMSAALLALVEEFGVPEAVVAHSLGAMVTMHAFGSDLPNGLILLAPVLDVEEVLDTFSRRAQLLPWTAKALHRRITAFVDREWPDSPHGADADMGRSKVLIIHDPADDDTPFSTSAALAAVRSDTDLSVVEGLGHTGILRDSGVASDVVEFLVGLRASGMSSELSQSEVG